MNRYAISFTVKPGTEPKVAELLRNHRRPAAGASAEGPPLLLRTSLFMAGQRVVRVIDVAGDIDAVMRHLVSQPQIRAVEAALNQFLASPRDLDSPEGVQAFLHSSLLPPTGQPAEAPSVHSGERCGFLFPVRSGRGGRAARLLADGAGATLGQDPRFPVTTFRRGDVLFGLLGATGDLPDALAEWAREAAGATGASELAGVMETSEDLTQPDGFRKFLEDCRMELLTDRRAAVPA